MSMVESNNYWDGIVNGVNSEEFANILNILDFPMESLEGDGAAGDLDPSNFQNMGPIPLDALTGVSLVPQGQIADAPEIKGSSRTAPINMKSERIELGNCVGYNNGANTPCESFISPKFRTFGTPSPVSILESGGSYPSGKLLTTKPEILESSGSCSSAKLLTRKSETVIPRQARSKRKRPSNLHPWFKISPIICSGSVANRFLYSGNNKDFNKQRSSDSSNVLVGLENSSRLARKKLPEGFYAVKKEETLDKQSVSTKKCAHCQVTKTPQWREGPLGPKTLCNACGVRYRSGRLLPEYRPASSPTFMPSVHSNSHKKVIEMRKKATQQDIEIEMQPMFAPPEFVPMSNNMFDPLC